MMNLPTFYQTVRRKVALAWMPPPELTVSEWADAHRKLSPEASAEPGRWRTDRAPYQRGMMDAVNEPGVREVVFMTSAQIGKTEILNNILGYFVHQDPSPILFIQPTLEMAEAWSKDRLAPMIRDTEALGGLFKDAKTRNSDNTLLHKKFTGGHLTMAGANSPSSLASRPIRIVLLDEEDRYPSSAGSEGDPGSLAQKRTTTFWNRLLVSASTPTIEGESKIDARYQQSDMRRFHVPCPECKKFQVLCWAQLKFDKAKPEAAYYECEHCQAKLGESDKQWMLARGESLRLQARYLDENHDLARGVLNCLVNNVVGRGITVEPQVKLATGELAKAINDQLLDLWDEWICVPEVTWELHWNQMLRLLARCWFRDGEVLVKHIEGTGATLNHGTAVPYSLELVEADFLPFDYSDSKKRIIHGVEKNAWRRPVAFYLYKEHPGDRHNFVTKQDTRRFPADKIIHLKITDRIAQTRGVSIFASVLTRMEDIKDYELSERLAAKVAASICAYVRKNLDAPVNPQSVDTAGNRLLKMQPGMIFDNLLPGEEVGMIDSNRPNAMLEQFRNSQLRAVAAGTSTSYSSISKDYNGTYSAQRQELVEQSVHYGVLRDHFIERCVRPIWERFVDMAVLSGKLVIPEGSINPRTLWNAGFQGPTMPWIDPKKEGEAEQLAVSAGFKSRTQVIRERGGNPQDVFEQIKQERAQDAEAGLTFSSSASKPVAAAPQPEKEGEDDAEQKPGNTDENA